MSKRDKTKLSDRSTPEASCSKVSEQSISSLVSESVEELEDGQESSSVVSLHTNDIQTNHNKVQILHNIIVERYEGDKCEDLFHGEGVAYFQGGHVYKGSFSNGLMHGRGEYIWSDGLKYQGDFKSNVPMGHGTYTWLDGSTYEGEIHHGIRHGVGTYKCAKTSNVYRGQWYLGRRQGKGIMHYNQASWYKGDWLNNCREGFGVRHYPSGNVYEGQWRNNVQNGEGTMRWTQLEQQYSGQWVNGVQDGKGMHTWFRRRLPCSQYPCMNEYNGEFVQGMRHGRGKFSYASGAVYCGEWKHDKKHGQGKYTFENGNAFEGEFIKDCVAEFPAFTPGVNGTRTPSPGDSPKIQSSTNYSLLGSDMALNIQTLLSRVPEAHRDQELKQVEFAVLRHIGLLREIYSFYSSLGHEQSPDKTFPLTHLQFLHILKDCNAHQHGITLAQMDRLISEDIQPDEVRSPFTTILPRECVSYIITTAYHIYYKDIESSNNVLAACFSKLMKQNIIPNAKNVKGPLFCHPVHAAVACNYTDRCWDIYQALCNANTFHPGQSLTVRHFIWMFKDLGLYDNELTVSKVLEILSVENPAIYNITHSNLDLEITFLEFFEALLGCAELKGKPIQDMDHHENTVQDITELSLLQNESRKQNSFSDISSCAGSTKSFELSLFEEMEKQIPAFTTKEAAEVTGTEKQLEDWTQKTQQFFTWIFFPAYAHSVKVKELVEEQRLRLIEKNKTALAEANDKQRHIMQLEAVKRREEEDGKRREEEDGKRREEEDGKRSGVPDNNLIHSPPPATTPVTSTTSVASKSSSNSRSKKKK
ncbi:radial spoke head 10 homolog B isoform X2 [Xyrauchen texanus]|uniref:radial spoke head 10 homolog B isoform X2 n=1 Tax=Xyrauchen texanus TaxID=154827 RepID=UPI0022422DF5|nr:radial spoke head 10 homolog B isoform X2 [Xyrauchen texanus]